MPDRVRTLAAHPFLAPSRCVVARGSQDVRPSHASQNGSLQGRVCVREKHSLDSASTGGGSPPQPPRAATHLGAKHKLRERTPVGAASRLLDGSTHCGGWHAAVMRTRDSSGGRSGGSRGRNRGVDTGLRGSLLCCCAVRGARPAGGGCETRTRDSRAAVGATARAGGIVELTPVCAARCCAFVR